MANKLFLAVSCSIFSLVTVLHVIRAVLLWPVTVGTYSVPVWQSWVAVVFFGLLSVWASALYRKN